MPYTKRRLMRKYRRGTKRPIGKTERNKIKRLTYKCNVQQVLSNNVALDRAVTDGGVTVHLSSIAQGNDIANRAGNAVKPRLLECRYQVIYDNAAANLEAVCRVLVVQGTPTANNPPTFAQLFEDGTSDTSCLYSNYNNDNVAIFGVDSDAKRRPIRVLYDSGPFTIVNANTTAAHSQGGQPIAKRIHFKRRMLREIEYQGTAATQYLNTPIYLVAFSSVAAASSPVISGAGTIWFDNVI